MNEREFARKIKVQLEGKPISPAAADRLRLAREAAVARATAKSTAGHLALGGVLVRFWHQHHVASIGMLLAVLLALSGSGWQWRQSREADRTLEAALLVDDLPVDLLLNERFDQWTRR